MPTIDELRKTAENPPDADLRIEGAVKLEAADTQPADLTLRAYVFDQGGRVLGEANLDAKGAFSVPVKLAAPDNVELVIGRRTTRKPFASRPHSQHLGRRVGSRRKRVSRKTPDIPPA
jgi:hypothetical protein